MDYEKDNGPGLERQHESLPTSAAPEIGALLDYWCARRGSASVPGRDDMDPLSLRPWLGHISIYEAVDSGRDFRNRLEGTAIVELTGENWTGRLASEADARFGSRLVSAMHAAIISHQAAIHTMNVYQNGYKPITRLMLPVRSQPDGPPDQVFIAIYVDPPAADTS